MTGVNKSYLESTDHNWICLENKAYYFCKVCNSIIYYSVMHKTTLFKEFPLKHSTNIITSCAQILVKNILQ